MAERKKLLYLIGQFPAINHSYLLPEIVQLRKLGFEVQAASVSPPDRPLEKLSPEERREVERTYYVKSVSPGKAALVNLSEFLRHPLRFTRGLIYAAGMGGGSAKRTAFHLAYFAEAVLAGNYMRQHGLTHVHANFSATVALLISKMFPVTMSFVVHGFGELQDPAGSSLAKRIEGAQFVRSISRYNIGQMMLACPRGEWPKMVYAPLGIDTSQFVPGPPEGLSSPPRILCVGRLAPEKGQALLLEAIAILKSKNCPTHLRLVGDGPDRSFLERRAIELGIATNIDFAGWVDHTAMGKEYSEADLFVLPSLAEGIPMVLMEAMAMQIPCVAPRITGIPELIEHGVDGMLFTVADVEDMSRKIVDSLSSSDRRREMGRRARERVMREYDMTQNTQHFADKLSRELDRPTRTSRDCYSSS